MSLLLYVGMERCNDRTTRGKKRWPSFTRFRARAWKDAADGSRLLLLSGGLDGSWFIRRRRDPRLDPVPMGAFSSAEAAMDWADLFFPGGHWASEA